MTTWLINCSNYQLEYNDVDGPDAKEYWILSHPWGEEEVTFKDMQNLQRVAQKVDSMCDIVQKEGEKYAWIDACCIDKSSSAELQEAIISMFYWYKNAYRCIAYLEDLELGDGALPTEEQLRKCRWFTRGWTLQELLAPKVVTFHDKEWNSGGTKQQLATPLSNITRIGLDILELENASLDMVPVAQKISWAAGRQTTRIEDKAYCLLGIFGVHMPLIYGERDQAFIRLQEIIAQKTNDMLLFAWIADTEDQKMGPYPGLLARDPSQFATCSAV
ncbi:hypothetical protein VTI74DRAFT_3934 [Chaetomium olivicolor]